MTTSPSKIAFVLGLAASLALSLPASTPAGATDLAPVSFTGHARTELPAARITAASGAAAAANYVLGAGMDSGWHTTRATSVLAVTAGALSVHAADGCALRRYETGETAVLPPGRHLIHNGESGPLKLTGVFTNLRSKALPFTGTPGKPARCAAVDGHEHDHGGTPEVRELGRGVPADHDAYGHSGHVAHGPADALLVEDGTDLWVATLRAGPRLFDFASGAPHLVIMTKGEITYYESQNGSCTEAGRFRAGEAYLHPQRGVNHLGMNEGDEPFEGVFVFFNVPRGSTPIPGGVGDYLDATGRGVNTDPQTVALTPPAGCSPLP